MDSLGQLRVALIVNYSNADALVEALGTSGRLPHTDVVRADLLVSRLHVCVAAFRCNQHIQRVASGAAGGPSRPGSGFVAAVSANRSMSESHKQFGFDAAAAAAKKPMLITVAVGPGGGADEIAEALGLVEGGVVEPLASLAAICDADAVARAYGLGSEDRRLATLESLVVNRISTFDV